MRDKKVNLKKLVDKIEFVSWHRNGICGMGFYAVSFTMLDEHGETKRMFAALFDEPNYCAVLDRDLLSQGIVEFGVNSWRGDRFEEELRPAIADWINVNGSDRIGTFSIPRL